MLSNHVCCTHLSNGKDKLNKIHLISGRSYLLYSEPPELLFRARGFLPTILTVVISPTRTAEDVLLHGSQDWKAQQVLCVFLVDYLFWTIFQFIISMHNIGNFPVNWHFLVQRSTSLAELFFLPRHTSNLASWSLHLGMLWSPLYVEKNHHPKAQWPANGNPAWGSVIYF